MAKKSLLHPDEIKDKARRKYPKVLSAWLTATEFFPLHIPGIGAPDDSLAVAQQEVQLLRSRSKECLGYGYAIQWQERNSRHHGRNLFPDRVVFEIREDYLRQERIPQSAVIDALEMLSFYRCRLMCCVLKSKVGFSNT